MKRLYKACKMSNIESYHSRYPLLPQFRRLAVKISRIVSIIVFPTTNCIRCECCSVRFELDTVKISWRISEAIQLPMVSERMSTFTSIRTRVVNSVPTRNTCDEVSWIETFDTNSAKPNDRHTRICYVQDVPRGIWHISLTYLTDPHTLNSCIPLVYFF